jgi:hypothetical protein
LPNFSATAFVAEASTAPANGALDKMVIFSNHELFLRSLKGLLNVNRELYVRALVAIWEELKCLV